MPGLRRAASRWGYSQAMKNVKKEIRKDGNLTMSELKDISYKGKKKGNKRKQLTIEKTTEYRVLKKKPKKPKGSVLSISKPEDISIKSKKKTKIEKPKLPKRKPKTRTQTDKNRLIRRTSRKDLRRKRKKKTFGKKLTGMTLEETDRLNRFVAGINIRENEISEAERKMLETFILD
jgi:hypothetical protein